MAHWFEELTKTLADEKMSRRRATRRISGLVGGAVLAGFWFPEQTLAESNRSLLCKHPGTCSTPFHNCGNNPNCYCFERLSTGKGVCGCNTICNDAFCKSQSDCQAGYVCVTNTGCACATGYCTPKCSKTCPSISNHAGRTAAGV